VKQREFRFNAMIEVTTAVVISIQLHLPETSHARMVVGATAWERSR
jgi:hypothetical protein